MVASSEGDLGRGRAERRRRWWSFIGDIVSRDLLSVDNSDLTDQVGLERMSWGVGLVDKERLGLNFWRIAWRSARQQFVQSDIVI